MKTDFSADKLVLLSHRFGRFDKRMPIGPVSWDFHDILWLHEGLVSLRFPDMKTSVELAAPAGILILPGTLFCGGAKGVFATASICHFRHSETIQQKPPKQGFMLPKSGESLHLQHLIRLSMYLAGAGQVADRPRRQRLLHCILDGFETPKEPRRENEPPSNDWLANAWEMAAANLGKMRTLSDVAGISGMSESGFRARHRHVCKTPAGQHLRELRLQKTEELLATTGYSLADIARLVGYGHPETLSTAFRKSRGTSPGQYRRWSKPFA
ncbi:MAG: hypothetical protein COB40_11995 [Marinosulfonomonas sp.]|nr:MAG: hypothetical protein COB40_11995 [Marinosulfonomonas sp.]